MVISFLLTFLVGAAFATIPGALQVAGGIGVGDPNLRVQWYEILGRETTTRPGHLGRNPAGYSPAVLAAHTTTDMARIVNFMPMPGAAPQGERGIDDRLEWVIGFTGEGSVSLDARAHNYGSLAASLATPTNLFWYDPTSEFHDMFTITYTILGTTGTTTGGTWPVILQPEDTVDIRITVAWDGDFPAGGFNVPATPFVTPEDTPQNNWNIDYWLIDLIGGVGEGTNAARYDWANNFFFNLVYTVAP